MKQLVRGFARSLTRVIAPFNTRAVSASGVGIISAQAYLFYRLVTNAQWLRGLYQYVAFHFGDGHEVFQLVGIAFGMVCGCVCLYVGAPWFITDSAPPIAPTSDAGTTTPPAPAPLDATQAPGDPTNAAASSGRK